MRKLILFVMVVLGTTLQAQSFDFSCAPDQVTIGQWGSNSGGFTKFSVTLIDGGETKVTSPQVDVVGLSNEVALTTTSTLVIDYIADAGYGVYLNTVAGTTYASITIEVVTDGVVNFDYTQDGFTDSFSLDTYFAAADVTLAELQALEITALHNEFLDIGWGTLLAIVNDYDVNTSILDYGDELLVLESKFTVAKAKFELLDPASIYNENALIYSNLTDVYNSAQTSIFYIRLEYDNLNN